MSDNVVEARRKSDRVVAIVLILGKEEMRAISADKSRTRTIRTNLEKDRFYDEMASKWDLETSNKIFLGDSLWACGKIS